MITRAGKLTVKTENRTDKSLFKFRCWHRILKDVAISHENVFKFKNASEGEGMYEHVKRKKNAAKKILNVQLLTYQKKDLTTRGKKTTNRNDADM